MDLKFLFALFVVIYLGILFTYFAFKVKKVIEE